MDMKRFLIKVGCASAGFLAASLILSGANFNLGFSALSGKE